MPGSLRPSAPIQRDATTAPLEESVLEYRGVELDPICVRVKYNEAEVIVPPAEFKLLRIFLQNVGVALARDELASRLWPENRAPNSLRNVDGHVFMLRRALRAKGCKGLIHTVRGLGYLLK